MLNCKDIKAGEYSSCLNNFLVSFCPFLHCPKKDEKTLAPYVMCFSAPS